MLPRLIKSYSLGMSLHNFKSLMEGGNMMEHVVRFLDYMGTHAKDADLCIREFSKSLTNTTYLVWKSEAMIGGRLGNPISLFNRKFFVLEAKFKLAKLG